LGGESCELISIEACNVVGATVLDPKGLGGESCELISIEVCCVVGAAVLDPKGLVGESCEWISIEVCNVVGATVLDPKGLGGESCELISIETLWVWDGAILLALHGEFDVGGDLFGGDRATVNISDYAIGVDEVGGGHVEYPVPFGDAGIGV